MGKQEAGPVEKPHLAYEQSRPGFQRFGAAPQPGRGPLAEIRAFRFSFCFSASPHANALLLVIQGPVERIIIDGVGGRDVLAAPALVHVRQARPAAGLGISGVPLESLAKLRLAHLGTKKKNGEALTQKEPRNCKVWGSGQVHPRPANVATPPPGWRRPAYI